MSTVPAVPAELNTALPNLLTALDLAMGDDFSQPAKLVRFETDAAGVALGLKDLAAGQHPLDVLMGFVAPDEWVALGVACHGWASRDLSGTRPSRAADRVRIRTFHVVARDGIEVGGFRTADDAAIAFQSGTVGAVPDALRRCLGLSTPDADFPVAELAAAEWIDAVLERASAVETEPTGYESWDQVRWETITGRRRVAAVTATLAAWMDEGMFARTMATTYPPLADHVATLRRTRGAPIAEVVAHRLATWGLRPSPN